MAEVQKSTTNRYRHLLAPGHWAGIISVVIALLLVPVNWHLSVVALAVYGLASVAAPCIPRLGFFLNVTSRGCTGRQAVALTFDDGPDPLGTPPLLNLLADCGVSATFFVTGSKVVQYPHLIEAIIEHGHSIGNHGYHHDPLIFFKGRRSLSCDIAATQDALKSFGILPRVYRPPVGILAPGLRRPLDDAGLSVVNFSCRAYDRGNQRIQGLAARILKNVRKDDIILLHDIMPRGEAYVSVWIREIKELLNGLRVKGLRIAPLQELIGHPVMETRTAPPS